MSSNPKKISISLRDSANNVVRVLGLHVALIVWLVGGYQLVPFWLYLIISPLVCVVHQRHLSEWFHEATHYHFVANRKWNDVLSNILVGILIGTSVEANRRRHFVHHGFSAFFSDGDPDTGSLNASSRRDLFFALCRDFLGYSAIRLYAGSVLTTPLNAVHGKRAMAPLAWLFFIASVHLLCLSLWASVSRYDPYLLYYLSLLTLYPLVNRIRLYAQHAAIQSDGSARLDGSKTSRNIAGSFVDRILFNSPVMAYHREHHRFPHLPYRELRALAVRSSDPNEWMPGCLPVFLAVARGLR